MALTINRIDSVDKLCELFDIGMNDFQYNDGLNQAKLESLLNPSGFTSSIKMHGVPVLPPVMSPNRRDECVTYRYQAILAETRLKSKKREKLLEKVQLLVDSIEDRMSPQLKRASSPKPAVTSRVHALSSDTALELKGSSDSGELSTLSQSYMFNSTDSSECQQTVIARDESSHFKTVTKALNLENEGIPAATETRLKQDDINSKKVLDDLLQKRSLVSTVGVDRSATEKDILQNKSLNSTAELNSSVRSDQRDDSSRNQYINDSSQSSESFKMFESSDSITGTASTEIDKYMKGSQNTINSSQSTLPYMQNSIEGMVTPVNTDVDVADKPGSHDHESDSDTIIENRAASRSDSITPVEEQRRRQDSGSDKLPKQISELNSEHLEKSSKVGKAEHMKRYLETISKQPGFLMNSLPENFSNDDDDVDGNEITDKRFSMDINDLVSMTEDDFMNFQAKHFEKLQKKLEAQQRVKLARLLWEQQYEQYKLEQDLQDQETRLRLAQDNLQSNQNNKSYEQDQTNEQITHRKSETNIDINRNVDNSMSGGENVNLFYQRPELLIRSTPSKIPGSYRRMNRIVVPEEAYDTSMLTKFDQISAAVKGYLTRRLIRTEKVQDLIKTIRDTAQFAISIQSDMSTKRGLQAMHDNTLLERVVAQLRAALLEVHEIFFEIPIPAKMEIITQSRRLAEEKRYKEISKNRGSIGKSNKNINRLSSATRKALERKRKEKNGDEENRPRTAPPQMRYGQQQRSEKVRSVRYV